MKPFNLARALAGDPVITRDGKRVVEEIYHFKADKSEWCVHVIMNGMAFDYCKDGTSIRPYDGPEDMDLMMAPIEKEYWMASGQTKLGYMYTKHCTRLCDTEDEIKRLVLGTGLLPETTQFHKIIRVE